ncbi:MAG: hypothetical protein E7331_00455 [Clostridiales bacterium]|nr:hypothetical protein [Clostridiales bacterium]
MKGKVRILTARPHRLLAPLFALLKNHIDKEENAILLVPEQLTLEMERRLMDSLNLQGFFHVDVLSPSRMYERVLEAAGRDKREPLSAAGRRMAVSLALEKLEDKLGYYGSVSLRRGFVEKTSALITDLKRGGMSPEMLSEYASSLPKGISREKLLDVAVIYAQYETVLNQRFSDSEDQLVYVAARLEKSRYLSGKHLYVYGFDTLPDQLMHLLCAAAPLAESLSVALMWDGESASDGELFLPIRQGVGRFTRMLVDNGMDAVLCPLADAPEKNAEAIRYLEKSLFVLSPKPYEKAQSNIFLFSGISPYEEATLVTRQIMRLLKEGTPIEKIAVLYPDGQGYDFAMPAALRDSGIPFYTDEKLAATSHGLVRYLLCALKAAADGWQNRDVLGMMKSGFSPLSYDECCELENYIFTCGINRARWLSPFTRGEDAALRERCELSRQKLIEPVQRMRDGLVQARSAAASMTAVFRLLEDVNAYQLLLDEEERLMQLGLMTRANQNSQVWQVTLQLMDQMVRLSEQSRIPLKHIATRMECGFSALSLGALPPAGNMLHVGILGHSLAEDMEAVFLLGLNDGVLIRETQSLLTAEEREEAQEKTGCFLGMTDQSRNLFARLDLKRAMTLPEKYLFLSYAKTSVDGRALRQLNVLKELSELFSVPLMQSPVPEEELPVSSVQALAEMSVQLRAQVDGLAGTALSPRQREQLRRLAGNENTAPAAMNLLRALQYGGQSRPISPESARALYGDETLSISRLEDFARCPFKHYLNYGIRPQVLREWKVNPLDTGVFYHAALSNFARLAKKESNYPDVSEERVQALAQEAMEPLCDEILNGPMGDGERNLARFELAKNAIHRAGEVITRQLKAGSFRIEQTEIGFGYEHGLPPIVLVLPDGREVMLRGRIDRVDRYDHEDSTYLRVIDYKSSHQDLEATRTWWGLQLQLLLYLDVCTSATPGAKPAGAFYFYVDDPLVETTADAAHVVEKQMRKIFRLKGITLYDVEMLEATDRGEDPCVISPVVLKNGELKKDAKALTLSQMQALMRHAREMAVELADQMLGGHTEILPVKEETRIPCEYCDYRNVCHFEPEKQDACFREIENLGMDDMRLMLENQSE